MTRILAADIGGTNSRFAFFTLERGVLELRDKIWLKTRQVPTFGALMEALARSDFSLRPSEADRVVIAVAGPVKGGLWCDPANIPWILDLRNARRDFGLKDVWMINDFEAQAFATSTDAVGDAKEILPGEAVPGGLVIVIGAGTGLGHCALAPQDHGGFKAVISEGGHSLFGFMNEEEYALARFIRLETGRRQIIGDLVVTGTGLGLLHKFLTGETLDPAEIGARITQGEAPDTLAWFSRFYGRACRNYALTVLATGGVFIAGGIAAKVEEVLLHPNFEEEFRFSETQAGVLSTMPVKLNTNEDSGLWGAAAAAAQREVRGK